MFQIRHKTTDSGAFETTHVAQGTLSTYPAFPYGIRTCSAEFCKPHPHRIERPRWIFSPTATTTGRQRRTTTDDADDTLALPLSTTNTTSSTRTRSANGDDGNQAICGTPIIVLGMLLAAYVFSENLCDPPQQIARLTRRQSTSPTDVA